VLAALGNALKIAKPSIVNSDQGSQYTSDLYVEQVLASQSKISMDGRGRYMDNIFTERLWRTVKYQEVYLHDYGAPGKQETASDGSLESIIPTGRIKPYAI